jgi:hypothetical protein
MPLFKYFLTVGTVLAAGLFALSAYLEPTPREGAAKVSVGPTTTSLLYFAPTPTEPIHLSAAKPVNPSPSKPAKTAKH